MIAFFDSGYGGLTVFKPVMDLMPQYDYIYLGDNARAPYGNHSASNIQKFSEEAVEYLFNRGVKLIIFACNTASSVALHHVQEKYLQGQNEKDRKILGVLIPVSESVATSYRRIGVVGTKSTVDSHAYKAEIQKLNKDAQVVEKACPLLVPFIEEDWHEKPEATSVLKKYLRPLKSQNIDALILGCTHYPMMKDSFKKIMGKKVDIIESGDITANSLKDYLTRHPEIETKLSKKGERTFLTTDDPSIFKSYVEKHFGMKISQPEKVEL